MRGHQEFLYSLVQVVLLYGSETWIMSPRIGRAMKGFHHQVVRIMTGRIPHRNLGGTWTHPSLEEAFPEADVQEV